MIRPPCKPGERSRNSLIHRITNKDTKAIGISTTDITPEENRYDACITFTGSVKPEGEVGVQTISGGRYAVFLQRAVQKLRQSLRFIMSEWYPRSGEKLRDLPALNSI
jgi:AraC family transcriptional regulator